MNLWQHPARAGRTSSHRARHRAERLFLEARGPFESAFANAPIGMALMGLDGRFLQVNPALCALTGRAEEELVGSSFHAIGHPDDRASGAAMLERVRSGEAGKDDVERRCARPDGTVVWVQVSVSLTHDPDGPEHFIAQFQDITKHKTEEQELRAYTEHLKTLALEDPLTGLYNHRAFHAAVEREIARARRRESGFAVVLFDVDRFKSVNDTHGHQAGDRLLRAVGEALRSVSRGGDAGARLGGDEFALLLPDGDVDGGTAAARRVEAAVAGLEPATGISYGVAAWAGEEKDALLGRADQALYAAKRDRARAPRPAREGALPGGDEDGLARVLALARAQLGVDVTYLAEFQDGRQHFRRLDGDPTSFGVAVGTALPVGETVCQRMMDGDVPNVVPDTRADPVVRDMPIARAARLGAYVGVPLHLSDGRLYGTLCGVSHAANPKLGRREAELMRFLAEVVAERLEHDEHAARRQRAESEISGMRALMAALEARDQYTGEHSQTVVELAGRVARRLGMAESDVRESEQVALLHDVGKVGIPDSILQKDGPLSDEEWELMRQHPALGARILEATTSLRRLAPAVRAEHERWDGAGYPDGLRGEQIPRASRITLACDAYHAMTSDRPYRRAMPVQDAVEELRANAGSQFDPTVVAALTEVLGEARARA